MQFKIHQTDHEACAVRLVPPEGSIVFLPGGPSAIDLAYAVLTRCQEQVNAFLPAAVRADIVEAYGQADSGEESIAYLDEAEQAVASIPKPPVTPMGTLAKVNDAHLADLLDVWRLFNAPYSRFEKKYGPADRGAKRLIDSGSESRRLDELERATAEASKADAERTQRQIDFAGRQYAGSIPDDILLIGIPVPLDGSLPEHRPDVIDEDDNGWHAVIRPAGIEIAMKSRPGRLIRRPGDAFPQGWTNERVKNAYRESFNQTYFNENERALRASRKGITQPPRPTALTIKYLAIAEEICAERAKFLNNFGLHSWIRVQTASDLVRGLCLALPAAVDVIDRAAAGACQGGKRPYEGFGWSRRDIEAAVVAAYETNDLAATQWGSLIPQGWTDKIAERVTGILPKIRAWLTGRDRATSPEIVAALVESGEDINPADPNEHKAIFKVLEAENFTKKRVRNPDGSRAMAFVRDGSDTPPPPVPGQRRWVETVHDLYPD